MEQTSETHVLEEKAEKTDNIEVSVIKNENEDKTENSEKSEADIANDDSSSIDEQENQSEISVEKTVEVKEIVEVTKEDTVDEVIKEENKNEVNEKPTEITDSVDLKKSEENKEKEEEKETEVKKETENNAIVSTEPTVEKSVEKSVEDVVELVDDTNDEEEEEVSEEEVEVEEETKVEEKPKPTENLKTSDKPKSEAVTTVVQPIKPVSNTDDNFEKRIENIQISENVIKEEKQILKEKGIEIRNVQRVEEKENKIYAENPTNQTPSYLNKIFTPAEDVPTPKNRQSEYIEEDFSQETKPANFPLKVVMNPRGKVRDLSSLPNEEIFTDTGLLSPDKCKELVSALNEPRGKGAELFAKRRKRAEKWAAENEAQENQNLAFNQRQEQVYHNQFSESKQSEIYHQQQDAHYNEPKPQEKYYDYPTSQPSQQMNYQQDHSVNYQQDQLINNYQPSKPLNQRELAYKPNVAQGWKSRPINLPTALYVPKEISLDSYNAPINTEKFLPKPTVAKNVSFGVSNPWTQTNGKQNQSLNFKVSSEPISSPWHEMEKQQASNSHSQPWIRAQTQPKPNYNYKPTPTHFEPYQSQTQYQPQPIKSQPQYQPPQPQYQPAQPQYQSPQPQYQSPQPQFQPPPQSQKPYQFRGQKTFNNQLSGAYNQNFNTAARGWSGSKMGHCYKPITFGSEPRRTSSMQYTDF